MANSNSRTRSSECRKPGSVRISDGCTAKIDPVDFIRRHGSRIVYADLRNEKADGKWPETLAEGVIDYKAVGEALRRSGFSGTLAIELAHERDFTPTHSYGASLRASREYVRRVMAYSEFNIMNQPASNLLLAFA